MALKKKQQHVPEPVKKAVFDPNKNSTKILAYVETCDDADKLRSLIANARKLGNTEVAEAAFRRVVGLVPGIEPGTVEHDFWRSVNAFEQALSELKGKTTKLSRTRLKVGKVGLLQTLRDWALNGHETDGFRMMLDRGMPEFTGEATALRYPASFEQPTLDAARARLTGAGVDLNSLPH